MVVRRLYFPFKQIIKGLKMYVDFEGRDQIQIEVVTWGVCILGYYSDY